MIVNLFTIRFTSARAEIVGLLSRRDRVKSPRDAAAQLVAGANNAFLLLLSCGCGESQKRSCTAEPEAPGECHRLGARQQPCGSRMTRPDPYRRCTSGPDELDSFAARGALPLMTSSTGPAFLLQRASDENSADFATAGNPGGVFPSLPVSERGYLTP